MQTIAAQRRFAVFFGIARMPQLRRNFRDGQLRSHPHYLRRRENLSRTGERRTAEPLLDDPVVLYIPVGKNADHHQRHREKPEQANPHNGIAGQQAATPAASTAASTVKTAASNRRNFQPNGHGDSCASSTKSNSQSETDFRTKLRYRLILNQKATPTTISMRVKGWTGVWVLGLPTLD